jgi:SAM-dependent methyltransferase
MIDPDEHIRRLADEALAADDPTGWYEQVYADAESGVFACPWDRDGPNRLLVSWAAERELDGAGRRAVVVGCGLGEDAEFVAGHGFDTVAFDISSSAIRAARERHPQSAVRYVTADLMRLPAAWREAFDLVVEIFTVQSLPVPLHQLAILHIGQMVRPGGTLLVIAGGLTDVDGGGDEPPWLLTRAEIDSFATAGLTPSRVEALADPARPGLRPWRAEFHRPTG